MKNCTFKRDEDCKNGRESAETDRQAGGQTTRRNIFWREQSMEIFRISLDGPVIREGYEYQNG